MSIGAITSSGTGSPSIAAMRSAQAPAALTITGASNKPALVRHDHAEPSRATSVTLTPSQDARPELLGLAPKGLRGAERIGGAIAARHDAARAGLGHRGHEAAELGSVDQLLVRYPSPFSSSTRARKLSNSSSVSATST